MLSKKSTFATIVALSVCAVSSAQAQETAPGQDLPLQRVSLFSSGVGYFERSGTVDGNAGVELNFQRDGLNDVLKSLIATDPSGQLRPATYSLPELLTRSQGNDLFLPSNQSIGSILRGFQGTEIAITTNSKTIQGLLLSVASKIITDEKGNQSAVEIASVLTDDGLQTVRLDELEKGGKVLLLDPALNKKLSAQLHQNAQRLASSVDDSYVPVTLHFDGKGKRTVSAGYIQGTSVWKTSYRLAFDSPGNKAKDTTIHPLLQGWAVVENTTNEDWNNISLNLIAGTPVSFTMNMAAPLYVRRPEVGVPFGRTLDSQVYSESMEAEDSRITDIENRLAKPPKLDIAPNALFRAGGAQGPQGPQGAVPAPIQKEMRDESSNRAAAISAQQLLEQRANVSDAERGELFEYAIDQPISLKRGEASMIPIVSQAVEADKVSIFDTRQNKLHAVNGLQLKNNTQLHLAGGPLTIYEDGTYAGDAQITDIAPGESRLISYSLDGNLVISRKPTQNFSFLTSMSVKKGVLTIKRREQKTLAYEFHNKTDAGKKVVILVPIQQGYELVKPQKPTSKSKNEYRFEISVPAAKNTDFETISEHTISQTVALLNTNIDTLLMYSREEKISPKLKTALTEIVNRRNAVNDIRIKREGLEKQVKDISADQDRIRSNMNSLPRDSDLYKTYMTKLSEQETQIEKLQQQIKEARQAEVTAQKAVTDYVQSLDIE